MLADSPKPETAEDAAPSAPDKYDARMALNPPSEAEIALRRANRELELLYAVELQISTLAELDTLIPNVIERVQALLGFEAVALLLVSDASSRVFAVHTDRGMASSVLTRDEAHRLLIATSSPVRRAAERSGNLEGVLPAVLDAKARETFSVPLSDGSRQIGVLQAINRRASADGEDLLRRLGLTAAQLGRAIVLRREREAVQREDRLALLGHSIGAVLHDLRVPMQALGSYVTVMADEPLADVRRDYATRACRALDDMERMAKDMLAFARGQREVMLRTHPLERFGAEVRDLLTPELERHGLELRIELEYKGDARFDASKLKRVLWNLARNACQVGARRFSCKITRAGEYLVLECRDDGPGLPAAMQERLFDAPSGQVKLSESGLGLAMTKKIIDAHRGRIYVESGDQQGTSFRIELPI
jgi:signal transduction histidine kinase